LYRQATQDNTTVAKQCNFVAAKAFLKIVIFAKFEIEKRDDNNFSVKHWKGRRIVRFGNNKSHLVCFVVCITGQYWSPLVPKVPLNQTSGFYKLNPKKTREQTLFLKIPSVITKCNIRSIKLFQNTNSKNSFVKNLWPAIVFQWISELILWLFKNNFAMPLLSCLLEINQFMWRLCWHF